MPLPVALSEALKCWSMPIVLTLALPFDKATTGQRWARNSSAGKASAKNSTLLRASKNTSKAGSARLGSSPARVSARRMDSRRKALRSLARSGRNTLISLRSARTVATSSSFSAVSGAWMRSHCSSASSALAMMGQMGHKVSSRSMLMALMRPLLFSSRKYARVEDSVSAAAGAKEAAAALGARVGSDMGQE